MAQVKVFYEPETELLTVFWQSPRKEQICTELGDGVILIKDSTSGEPIGLEILSYRPGDNRYGLIFTLARRGISVSAGWVRRQEWGDGEFFAVNSKQ
ncbi:MAG: hypothetical protein ACK5QJ_19075 [Microcystis sp.]|jgi:hypothetical protein|uniref:hypothetical protein n=1 Tax=Microcystis sp. TaxID=1127 RepID=UPI0022BA9751|nr:hypothetical protein [Microcystis sp. LE17-20D]MCZ8066129.1 hypothetical protein [Microcystis sp. LE17-20D]MCZ8162504.1 hypothetical protein [Microcystis sp. LE19-196.1B]MCZ8275490.1 hypothetical protein [Microcystis sp. LE19-4.1E]